MTPDDNAIQTGTIEWTDSVQETSINVRDL
jgi:hypothetical protein